MDIKDIIKWFIPCFHVLLLAGSRKMTLWLTFLASFLLFCPSYAAKLNGASDVGLSNSYLNAKVFNISENKYNLTRINYGSGAIEDHDRSNVQETSVGRTFGRPFKKMIQAFIPLAFQMGAASTWAVVAALVGVKTLAVTLFILKLLLIAGAAKIGALFASKTHHSSGWEAPHQKEIHLHIHNGHHAEEQIPISPWSREGQGADTKNVNVVYEPYGGPQTISTPYGHYMKIEPANRVQ
ncbi:uncharacterized protein LOC119836424 [Zerene cesonia]|uniref:uncharacterized protein LOC119836424 n=1 Tax=Zerene cesonia TaxID=33412 RepID=UPI0018E58E43|nr:uncharacterized protein LOC119836424 [Zerene cesonia]